MTSINFSKDHIWIKPMEEPGLVSIGLTDYAQKKLGAIVFLNLPETGEAIEAGSAFGDVESIKAVTDLIAPVSGKVWEINEGILDAPEQINEKPYECWLFRMKLADAADGTEYAAVAGDLMDEAAYRKYVESL